MYKWCLFYWMLSEKMLSFACFRSEFYSNGSVCQRDMWSRVVAYTLCCYSEFSLCVMHYRMLDCVLKVLGVCVCSKYIVNKFSYYSKLRSVWLMSTVISKLILNLIFLGDAPSENDPLKHLVYSHRWYHWVYFFSPTYCR